MSRTRPRTRRYPNFTDGQVRSLVKDGEYRHRDIRTLNKLEVPYDTIKNMETFYRENDPSIPQKKRAKKTASALIKTWRSNSPGTRSRRSSNSSGTRSRRSSNSSGTRSRRRSRSNSSGTRSRRGSNSSGTRSRRGSRSNSSGTRGRRISSSRSLHTSDL